MRIFVRTTALFLKYWKRALIAYLCLFAGAALTILIPHLTGSAIDQALSSHNTSNLILTALAIGAAGIFRSGLSYWQTYLAEYLSQKVAYDLRNRMYDHIQRLSYAFHDKSQTGQLMSKATVDIESLRMFVSFALLRGVYFLLLLVVVVVILLIIDWKLALISLSVLPFLSYRTITINSKMRVLWGRVQQGLGILGTTLQENLSGAKIVRAFAREDYESRKFKTEATDLYNQEIKINNLFAANSPVMSFALVLSMAAILWFGGKEVIDGSLTQGELAQFLIYLVILNMPIRMMGWLIMLFSRALVSGKRIFDVLDQVSPVTDQIDSKDVINIRGELTFKKVGFAYNTETNILEDIDFHVKPGQVVALVGASGSGKSTIANLIPRFYDVTSGSIEIDGLDIRQIRLFSLRKQVGMIHQDTFLFSASIRDNLSYGIPDASEEAIIKAAKTAKLHDFIMSLPETYSTLIGERGITLSGGQKQRLAIARCLLTNPKILIMDDSTSSVDNQTEYLIQSALSEVFAGRTTFIIAHRLHSVERADLILVLDHGKIVERGTHQELLAREGLYKRLYGLQFQSQENNTAFNSEVIPSDVPVPLPLKEPEVLDISRPARGVDSFKTSDELVYGKPYDSKVVQRLVGYFKAQKSVVIITILATLLFTLSSLASPYIVAVAENRYITSADVRGLTIIVLALIGMGILNWISYALQIRAEARLGQSILLNLRTQLFDHLQKLSLCFFSHNEVGRIMSRVQNDVNELNEFLEAGAFWVIGEVVTMLGIMVVMLGMEWRLALITLSVVPVLILFIAYWQSRARKAFIQVRQAISAVNGALEENISGIRIIQSLSREDLNAAKFEKLNRYNFQTNIDSARISAAMMPAVELLLSVATTVIILYGGQGVLNSTFLVGTLIAFILYINNFFDPIRNLTMEYAQLQIAMASGSRIFELLDVQPDVKDITKPLPISRLKGEIVFDDISFSYEPEVEVLHHLSFKIESGSTVALVGPTGAGKSTILNLLARFYDVSQGRIMVDGFNIKDIDSQAYRGQLGLVLQDPFLFSGTIRTNIQYGNLNATPEEIEEAATLVGAHEFITHLEKGYDTELEERGQNLSMGQRQLISFSRAVVANPAILLLDEATSSIDSYSENIIQAGLQGLTRNRTTIIIAHRLSTIRNADRIFVLNNGSLAEEGNHKELLIKRGLYAQLYAMNFRSGTTDP